MFNSRLIFNILGFLLMIEGFFMMLSIPVSFIYHEHNAIDFLISGIITFFTGGSTWILTRAPIRNISKREGYIIATAGWMLFSIFGTLPYLLTGSAASFTDAFFETISGFTTTGASVMHDVESLSHGILLWRSLTQWIGGMGIIILSLALLPLLGIGGMQLFVSEVPGSVADKLNPRIRGTAKRVWLIYVAFTLMETGLLILGNMDPFDALNHSLTTLSTGGFSTKQAGIAYWDSPYIHYIITLFMFIAGMNFTLSYFVLQFRFKMVFRNEEFRYYLGFVILFSLVIGLSLWIAMGMHPSKAFRDALFQVVSVITTTGFYIADYRNWIPILGILIFMLMFFGGSSGSTGAGIKIMRLVLLLKNSSLELKRLVHPNAVIPVRFNNQAVEPHVTTNALAYVSLYILIIVASTVVMTAMGYDLNTSAGAVTASLGNIGPGMGEVGPFESYSHIPAFGKWFLAFLMLIGRLELFTVLVLFSPEFWRR